MAPGRWRQEAAEEAAAPTPTGGHAPGEHGYLSIFN